MSREPTYTEFEEGERRALLEARTFITTHDTKEVDAYCAQRLHDIMMDARHRDGQLDAAGLRPSGKLSGRPGAINYVEQTK